MAKKKVKRKSSAPKKKAVKRAKSKNTPLKVYVHSKGLILPHGYEIRKKK